MVVLALLSGCATAYPSTVPAALVEAERQRILDLSWQNLGLAEPAPRPTPSVTPLAEDADWVAAWGDCVSSSGTDPQGWGFGSDTGFDFRGQRDYDDRTLLAFYTCAASLPLVPFAAEELRTPAQVDYLYDYYQSWLVPCLETHGYHVSAVPTNEQFVNGAASWSPLDEITLLDLVSAGSLLRNCGYDPADERLNEYLAQLQATADEITADS